MAVNSIHNLPEGSNGPEHTLRESKDLALLARIVEHTPLVIIVTEPDGAIRYVNATAQTVLEYSRQHMLGTPLERYLVEIEGYPSFQEVRRRMGEGDGFQTRLLLLGNGNEEHVCLLNAFEIKNDIDKRELLVFIFRDITTEVRGSEQLEMKNIEMAKINSELIRNNTELKRISELKSNFLSIASHELKTPLTSIKGYSDIIIDGMKDKLDPDIYRMIESINRAADRLHKVVNNILDVTRIEQKRLRLKPEHIDLPALARESIEELVHFSVKRSISFDCRFPPDLPTFFGDRLRMQQVFANLFSNALKFSPDKSAIVVAIEVKDRLFHITVKDQGIGIDKNEYAKIFDPFYEIGSANRHSTDVSKFMGGGTGLGLSIVKGIIERHGGQIWVESEGVRENEYPGSVFHITVPIEAEISWDDDETKALFLAKDDEKHGQSAEVMAVEKKPVILFIDADKEAVEIASMTLQNAFDILVAENGENGLQLSFDHHPDLILLDSYLPGLDGYRLCRILRSQEETRDIPVVFFSAGTQNDEIQKCFASGAIDFIVKPFNGRELLDKIWRLLMRKKEITPFG
ncbi:MAG: ATP-binding protein [Chitinivibrionales bacterium]|nr:ATP-binding protein [Chitinivibrionales bacterium]